MNSHDKESEFYKDPANQEPVGPARRRKTTLTEVVPIRLSTDTLERARTKADDDGRSLAAWIRELIDSALDAEPDVENEAETQHAAARVASFPVLINADTVFEISPERATAAQVVLSGGQILDEIEHQFGRLAKQLETSAIADVFEERVQVDTHAFRRWPRSYATRMAGKVNEDVRQLQGALVLLQRLSRFADENTLAGHAAEFRGRIASLRALINAVEDTVLAAPKAGSSDMVDAGVVAFYRQVDMVRDAISELDEQMFQIQKAPH